MPDLLRRAYEAKIDDVVDGERSVVARINTDAIDRFKSVIDPLGADLAAYRKNPVVLWEHGLDVARGNLPVGRNLWIKIDKQARTIVAKTKFAEDEFADGLFRLYQGEFLKGFSIRGNPDPATSLPPSTAEIRKRPELAEARIVYRKWELVEYSAVAVPGNPDALATAVARGLWVPESLLPRDGNTNSKPEPLPPLTGARRFEDVHAALVRNIRAMRVDLADQASAVMDLYLRGRV